MRPETLSTHTKWTVYGNALLMDDSNAAESYVGTLSTIRAKRTIRCIYETALYY